MQLIAHGVETLEDCKKATDLGYDLLEVDISQSIINGKFTIQHSELKGKLGIGKKLDEILNSKYADKLVLDLKHIKYSLNYERKFNEYLKKEKMKNLKLTGIDLKIVSRIAEENNAEAYYGFLNEKSIRTFYDILLHIYKPSGFSINHDLITQNLVEKLKTEFPKSQIWAWTVNDQKEIKRLKKLGVETAITDNWKI